MTLERSPIALPWTSPATLSDRRPRARTATVVAAGPAFAGVTNSVITDRASPITATTALTTLAVPSATRRSSPAAITSPTITTRQITPTAQASARRTPADIAASIPQVHVFQQEGSVTTRSVKGNRETSWKAQVRDLGCAAGHRRHRSRTKGPGVSGGRKRRRRLVLRRRLPWSGQGLGLPGEGMPSRLGVAELTVCGLPRAAPPASGVPSRVGRFRCSRWVFRVRAAAR